MSAATKVTIAVAILFAAVLGIYYGFSGSAREGPIEEAPPVAQSPLPAPEAEPAAREQASPPPAPVSPAAPGGAGTANDAVRTVPGGAEAAPAAAPAAMPAREEIWVVRAPALADPAAAVPGAVQPAGYREFFVRDGDSLWLIADAELGDPLRWREIAEVNPGVNPDRLLPGTLLRIPTGPARALGLNHAAAVAAPAAPAGAAVHVIQSGDSLSAIARIHYGDPARWRPIFNANRAAIGGDPDRLRVGTRLVIPPLVPPAAPAAPR
jgi:nucleoid-associated protein YgaU